MVVTISKLQRDSPTGSTQSSSKKTETKAPLAIVVPDIDHLEPRGPRQDDVCHEAVVLEPRMHGHDALDGGLLQRLNIGVGVVPARDPARRVGPDHVDLRAAGSRKSVCGELLFRTVQK